MSSRPAKRRFPTVSLWLAALIGAGALAQPAEPRGEPVLDVRAFGATGDGRTDDTAAFRAAIAEAATGGLTVYVPKGRYAIGAPLVLETVTIRGPEGAAWPADVDAMPTILPTHRDGPAFELAAAGAIRGLNIDYRWEEEPEAGPPAILIRGIGVYVSNTRIRYPFDGILCDGKSNVGRLNLENLFLVSPRNVGVRVTGTWDVPRLNNIEVWNAGPVPRGLNRGIGFHLGKNDLIRMTDCFVFAMGIGYLLEDRIQGAEIEGGTWGVMNGCSTDYCGRSIVVRGEHTLSFSGGTLWTHGDSLVVEGEGARVRITGTELKSNGGPCAVIRGGDHTILSGCTLLRPMKEHPGPAVRVEGGTAILSGNRMETHGDGIFVGAGAEAVSATGNLMTLTGERVLPVRIAPDAVAGRIADVGNLALPGQDREIP